MALDLTALSPYTKQLVRPLLTSAVIGAKTQQLIMDNGIVLTGVKSSAQIPLMDTDAVFQTDACGYSPSGTTTFTQRTVTVGKIMLVETICPKTFESYFKEDLLLKNPSHDSNRSSMNTKIFIKIMSQPAIKLVL